MLISVRFATPTAKPQGTVFGQDSRGGPWGSAWAASTETWRFRAWGFPGAGIGGQNVCEEGEAEEGRGAGPLTQRVDLLPVWGWLSGFQR